QEGGDPVLGGAEREQRELRNVDDDRRGLERREPAPALQGERELADALRHRSLQRGERRLAERTVGGKTVPVLEVAHPGAELRIEGGVSFRSADRRQVAEGVQQLAQRRRPLVVIPHLDRALDGRERREVVLTRDVAVLG